MSHPWDQQPQEPEEAYAAYLRDKSKNGHLVSTDQAILQRHANHQEAEWCDRWEWDKRSSAWDAEADRRRSLEMARLMSVASSELAVAIAADVTVSAQAQLASDRYDTSRSEKFHASAESLALAFKMHNDAATAIKELMNDSVSSPRATRPKTKRQNTRTTKPRTTTPKTTDKTSAEPQPSAPEPTNEPDIDDLPAVAMPASVQQATPTSAPPEPHQIPQTDADGLLPPTTGPGCERGQGVRGHKDRGERLCDKCYEATQKRKAYTQKRKLAETTTQHTQVTAHAARVPPVMLRPTPQHSE